MFFYLVRLRKVVVVVKTKLGQNIQVGKQIFFYLNLKRSSKPVFDIFKMVKSKLGPIMFSEIYF